MEETLKFDSNLIFRIDTVDQEKTDVLSFLADRLEESGYVKDSYKEGILKRESVYPTGLFTGGINVAVPHTDSVHVKEDAVTVGVLSQPILFKAMEDSQKDVAVSIVLMLALKEPHGQVKMLQKILALVKEQETLKELLRMQDENRIYESISAYLK
ncbi:PTS sugar transporter subunit IIA [Anaerosinus massiliensis]|uniref:PTS sugar transporter subunit IIA n=1 Tax=Massilibacillus massiliensis TaxID=1806837 RepID=UPI000DA5F1CD|nr:PTS sugar transporter subunit IIA [Massilibacillus massiliensis]